MYSNREHEIFLKNNLSLHDFVFFFFLVCDHIIFFTLDRMYDDIIES